MTLAVRADGDLARVAPSGADDRHYSVEDCLAALRAVAGRRASDAIPALEL